MATRGRGRSSNSGVGVVGNFRARALAASLGGQGQRARQLPAWVLPVRAGPGLPRTGLLVTPGNRRPPRTGRPLRDRGRRGAARAMLAAVATTGAVPLALPPRGRGGRRPGVRRRALLIEASLESRPSRRDTTGITAVRKTYPHREIGPGLVLCPAETPLRLRAGDRAPNLLQPCSRDSGRPCLQRSRSTC